MLKTKQYAVYPSHGVGYIEKIETKEIAGTKQKYYVLNIEEKKMKILLPVKKAEELGFRPVMEAKDVTKVFRIFNEKTKTKRERDWKARYQASLNKFKNGSVKEIAEVVRDLFKRHKKDDLSVMEKKLFEASLKLLADEIAIVKKLSPADAKELIIKKLSKKG